MVEKVAKEFELGKEKAEQAIASIFGAITDAMAAGDKVALRNLIYPSGPPVKDATIYIPAKKVVKFKAGTKLADSVK